MTGQYLTPEQVAEKLQVTAKTVRLWCQSGLLPGKKIGKVWRISQHRLEEFLGERP